MTAPRPPDTDLPFLRGYAEPLLAQVRGLLDTGRRGDYLAKRYPNRHQIQSDKALHAYVDDLLQTDVPNPDVTFLGFTLDEATGGTAAPHAELVRLSPATPPV